MFTEKDKKDKKKRKIAAGAQSYNLGHGRSKGENVNFHICHHLADPADAARPFFKLDPLFVFSSLMPAAAHQSLLGDSITN